MEFFIIISFDSTGGFISDIRDINWYDYQFGAIREYLKGEDTLRAAKYALENYYGFPNLETVINLIGNVQK